MRMKAEGIESVSLCLIPGLGCEEGLPGDSALIRRALCFGKRHLNFVFDFAGLYHFKSRFRPALRKPLHLRASRFDSVNRDRLLPDERNARPLFDIKKIVKDLARNRVKRRERRHLAHRGRIAGSGLRRQRMLTRRIFELLFHQPCGPWSISKCTDRRLFANNIQLT